MKASHRWPTHHAKYVLLAFSYKEDAKIGAFLKDRLRIVGFESALFVIRKPRWAKPKSKAEDFWGATGIMRRVMERLHRYAIAPMVLEQNVSYGYPLPQLQELLTAGWPKKKDRLGRAILAVALRQGGLDLADATTVSRVNLTKREYHHLFPDAQLKRLGRSDDEIYRSLNCAVVTWQTNRNISDKEPERYLAQRRDGNELGDDEIKVRLDSHLIPFEEMITGDYDKFLMARATLVHSKMTALCAGGSK